MGRYSDRVLCGIPDHPEVWTEPHVKFHYETQESEKADFVGGEQWLRPAVLVSLFSIHAFCTREPSSRIVQHAKDLLSNDFDGR